MRNDSENPRSNPSRVLILKIAVSVLLMPLLPLAVALNFLDAADQLSPIPGIKHGGGVVSGVMCLVYVGVIISIVAMGGMVVTGDSFQLAGGPEPASNSTTTPTPSATPVESQTRNPTRTSTPTPSDAEIREDYERARQEFLNVWESAPQDHPSTPELLGTEARVDQDALWVVFDETDVFENASRMRDEWTTIANIYLHVINNHTGTPPERMVAIGWNNTGPITYFRVETDDARAYLRDDIEYDTYYNRYFRSIRATTDAERSIAREIAEHPPDDN